MEEPRIDLSALDPGRDPAEWERRVARIRQAAAPGLAHRAAAASPIVSIAAWLRPTLAAAATLTVVSAGALLVTERTGLDEDAVDAVATFAVPESWLTRDEPPTVSEVLVALEGDGR